MPTPKPSKKPAAKKPAAKKPAPKKAAAPKKQVAAKPAITSSNTDATIDLRVDPNANIVGDPGNAGVEAPAWNDINPKVNAAGIGGAAYTVALYVASQFGVDLSSVPVEVLAAGGVLVAWLSGYMKRIKS
jgi:hypothetical protein